jgi:hypothetical protein
MLSAQYLPVNPNINTAFFHSRLDAAQKSILKIDGRADDIIHVSHSEAIDEMLTHAATIGIDSIQLLVEQSATDNNRKARYLRGFTDLLRNYTTQLYYKKNSWLQLPNLVNSFKDALQLDMAGTSILPAVQVYKYSFGQLLIRNMAFENNPGLQQSKEYVLLKLLEEKPDMVMDELIRDNNYSYADSLIQVGARREPQDIFTCAQAPHTLLGQKVMSIGATDSLVALIIRLAQMNTGQMYLPFLDRLYSGELSMEDIAKARADSNKYYKLLVATEVQYAGRTLRGDMPFASKPLADMLKQKSSKLYVNTINGLHDYGASVRFRSIQRLTPEELYYLIVMNEETIYTSSYIYVYHRIYELLPVKSSDTLMQRVNYDRYKKFISMASNYNMLANFLGKMDTTRVSGILTSFVSNLEKGRTGNDIEDAVDVINAYATISQPAIRKLMLDRVSQLLDSMTLAGNQRGYQVYRIEKLIMESREAKDSINLTDSLGIPPVYQVKNEYLRDTMGRIIMQMFFLDDGTGKGSFVTLSRLFGNRAAWKINSTPEWVQWTSIGTPVPFVLYANRPLDGKKDEDDLAQKNLTAYLAQSGNNPSITVHRGHSFSLKYTIEKMLPSSKVVVLGSCGAYQNLSDILKVSPEAYIISSKQVGYGEINVALFMYLVEKLKNGKDISWPGMMSDVSKRISAGKRSGYDDYVFPHQNLGALFIQAYKNMQQQQGTDLELL